ncbi:MAG: hypothetical protein Q8942_10360 [Bacillota bacterium]|nr:hypothetical protein [Bacillota bacterium]
MDEFAFTRTARNNSYEISVNNTDNIIIIAFLGLWDKTSQLEYYLDDIKSALEKIESGFNLIIDLSLYKGSISENIHLHVEAQNLASEAGLSRTVVILHDNPLLKITVEYILQLSGINATFLSNFPTSLHWLTLFDNKKIV